MTAKLEDRIQALSERLEQLKARQARIETRKRLLASKRARRDDTRRKILVGAVVLARVEQGRLADGELRLWLDQALTRTDDRALFELAPLNSGGGIEPPPRSSVDSGPAR